MKPDIMSAISALAPLTNFSVENGKINGWDLCEVKSNQVQPTEEAIQTKLATMISDWETQEYARNRASAYDSVGNQLDLLFHDMTAGKGTKSGEWYKAIAKVKADNPKG
jgi:hypothetical protein